ncbi:hypothetical protein A4X13_0g444 [Tilletia indica]|uniref:Uncharacterized protein n=1 Tax=Tilletia indica TaxID=43049 RepID=A0A177TLI3_9BASI|nr:hypothetical protein A4X13_0g444 [Tilletia indica]
MPVVVANAASSSTPAGPSYTPAHASAVERVRRARGNPYMILDVPNRTTDHAVLKTAKRKGALSLHPDKNRHPGAAEAMKQFNEAFETLISLPEGHAWAAPAPQPPPQPAQPKPQATSSYSYQDPYQRFKHHRQQQEQEQQRRQQQQQQQQQQQRSQQQHQKQGFTAKDPRFQSRAQGASPKASSSRTPFDSFFSSNRRRTAPGPGPQRPYSANDYFTNSGSFGQARASTSTGSGFRQYAYEPEMDEESEEEDDEEEEDIECTGFRRGPQGSAKASAQPSCDNCHREHPMGVWPHSILSHFRLCRDCLSLPKYSIITKEQAIAQLGLTEEELRLFADNIPADQTPVAGWQRNAYTLHGHPLTRIYLRAHLEKIRRSKQETQRETKEREKQRQEQWDARKKEKAAQADETADRGHVDPERARLKREAEARAALLERAHAAEQRRRAAAEAEMEERRRAAAEAEMAQRNQHDTSARCKTEGQQGRPSPPEDPAEEEEDRSEEFRTNLDEVMEETIRRHCEAAQVKRARPAKAEPNDSRTAHGHSYGAAGSSSSHQTSTATEQARATKAKTRSRQAWDEIDDILEESLQRQHRRAEGRENSEDREFFRRQEEMKRRREEEAKAKAAARRLDPQRRQRAAFEKMREDLKAQRAAEAAAEAEIAAEFSKARPSGRRAAGNGQYRTPYVVSDDSDDEPDVNEAEPDRSASSSGSNRYTSHSTSSFYPQRPGSFYPHPFPHGDGAPPSEADHQRRNHTRSASVVTISDSGEEVEFVSQKRSTNGKARMQERWHPESATDEDADGDEGSFTTARDAAGATLESEESSEGTEFFDIDSASAPPKVHESDTTRMKKPRTSGLFHQPSIIVENADDGIDKNMPMGSGARGGRSEGSSAGYSQWFQTPIVDTASSHHSGASSGNTTANPAFVDTDGGMPFPFYAPPGATAAYPTNPNFDERANLRVVDEDQGFGQPSHSQRSNSAAAQRNRRRSSRSEAFLQEAASATKKVRFDGGPSMPTVNAADSPFGLFDASAASSSPFQTRPGSDLENGEASTSGGAWFLPGAAQSSGVPAPAVTISINRSRERARATAKAAKAAKTMSGRGQRMEAPERQKQRQEVTAAVAAATAAALADYEADEIRRAYAAQAQLGHGYPSHSTSEPVTHENLESAFQSLRNQSFAAGASRVEVPVASHPLPSRSADTLNPVKVSVSTQSKRQKPNPSPTPSPNPTFARVPPARRATRSHSRKKEAGLLSPTLSSPAPAPALAPVAEAQSELPFQNLHLFPTAANPEPFLENEMAQGLRIDPRPPMFQPRYQPAFSASASASAGPSTFISASPFSVPLPHSAPITPVRRSNGGRVQQSRKAGLTRSTGNPSASTSAMPFWQPLSASRPAPVPMPAAATRDMASSSYTTSTAFNPSEFSVRDVEMADV